MFETLALEVAFFIVLCIIAWYLNKAVFSFLRAHWRMLLQIVCATATAALWRVFVFAFTVHAKRTSAAASKS